MGKKKRITNQILHKAGEKSHVRTRAIISRPDAESRGKKQKANYKGRGDKDEGVDAEDEKRLRERE